MHALLSPSSAHRWLKCAACARLEASLPPTTSAFAEEGTLAHAVCAKLLKEYLGADTSAEVAEIGNKEIDPEMAEAASDYATRVIAIYEGVKQQTPDAQLLVEQRVSFDEYVPDGYGTSDAIIIGDGVMHVVDFKYGKGVEVSAEDNPQMMIYALGAYLYVGVDYGIDTVHMHIHQPRIRNFSSAEISITDLLAWADKVLRLAAKKAYNGSLDFVAGDHCRFCAWRSRCVGLAHECVDTYDRYQAMACAGALTTAEVARILEMLPVIKAWVSTVEEDTLRNALNGVKYDNFKLVRGRSVRTISDPDKMQSLLERAGYSEDDYMRPRQLQTLSVIEKLVGKKNMGQFDECITKPEGKPTLVSVRDKRPEINTAESDFANLLNTL